MVKVIFGDRIDIRNGFLYQHEGVATKQISWQFRILMQMRIIENQFVYNYEFNKNNMYQSSSVNPSDFDLHTTKHIKCR